MDFTRHCQILLAEGKGIVYHRHLFWGEVRTCFPVSSLALTAGNTPTHTPPSTARTTLHFSPGQGPINRCSWGDRSLPHEGYSDDAFSSLGREFHRLPSRSRTSAGMEDSPALDGGGIRFEIWDHDIRGGGNYLGKRLTTFSRKLVYFTPAVYESMLQIDQWRAKRAKEFNIVLSRR